MAHHPADLSSIDALLRDQPREVIDLAMKLIEAITNVSRPEQHPDERSPKTLVIQSSTDEAEPIPTKEELALCGPTSERLIKPRTPVAERLRLLRKAEGYQSGSDFARALGTSVQRYMNVETGLSLSIELAQRIVDLVPGCSLDWLYNGIETGLTVDLLRRLRHAQKP